MACPYGGPSLAVSSTAASASIRALAGTRTTRSSTSRRRAWRVSRRIRRQHRVTSRGSAECALQRGYPL